jgi:transposase-like protein
MARAYSDEDKAAALAALKANAGNVKRTATQVGVPARTVRRWRDEPLDDQPQGGDDAAPRPRKKRGAPPSAPRALLPPWSARRRPAWRTGWRPSPTRSWTPCPTRWPGRACNS